MIRQILNTGWGYIDYTFPVLMFLILLGLAVECFLAIMLLQKEDKKLVVATIIISNVVTFLLGLALAIWGL